MHGLSLMIHNLCNITRKMV